MKRMKVVGKFLAISTLGTFVFMGCADTKPKEQITFPAPTPPPDTILSAAQEKLALKVDHFFAAKHKAQNFNGTILVGENGKVLIKEAYGVSNLKTKKALTTDAAFQLASVSKSITSYGVLKLVADGKVNLDAAVQTYLPKFPYQGITVRMLLSHRSGLNNYMYFADEVWPDRFVNPITNQDVLRLYAEHQPAVYRQPDTRYEYSNTGYMLLASIVEKVTGQAFEAYMKTNIFDPLEMHNTSIYRKGKSKEISKNVIGYEGNRRVAEDTYLNGVVGDKGVYSTVEDLYKLDQAMASGKVVPTSLLNTAFTAHNEKRKNKDNYGLGWRIRTFEGDGKVVYHTGWWKGFRSYFIRDLRSGRTIIALDNIKRGQFLKVTELINLIQESPAS